MIFLISMLLTFAIMEGVTWLTHKYVMHGFLWSLHKDHHHKDHKSWFERNDVFFLMYAIPSWLCIMLGMMNQNLLPVWIGFGIAAYGLAYFLIHDVYIHRRFKWLRDIEHPYFYAIRRAHKIHHKHLGKEHGECFGMLLVPIRFYIESAKQFKKQERA